MNNILHNMYCNRVFWTQDSNKIMIISKNLSSDVSAHIFDAILLQQFQIACVNYLAIAIVISRLFSNVAQ